MHFQQNATLTLEEATAGDSWGLVFYPTMPAIVTGVAGVNVGSFCWLVNGTDDRVVQAKGANTELAGFVLRTNTNVWLDASGSFSMNCKAGFGLDYATRGNFYAPLTGVVGSATQANYGDIVYARETDGALFVGGPLSGYTATNYLVRSVTAAVGALVKISNVTNVT